MTQKNRKLVEQLRGKDEPSLRVDLIKLRREQFSLRMQSASGQAVKPSDFSKVKKSIARVKTVMNEKKAAGAKK